MRGHTSAQETDEGLCVCVDVCYTDKGLCMCVDVCYTDKGLCVCVDVCSHR